MALDLDWLMADWRHYCRHHELDQWNAPADVWHEPDSFEDWLGWQDPKYLEEHSLQVED